MNTLAFDGPGRCSQLSPETISSISDADGLPPYGPAIMLMAAPLPFGPRIPGAPSPAATPDIYGPPRRVPDGTPRGCACPDSIRAVNCPLLIAFSRANRPSRSFLRAASSDSFSTFAGMDFPGFVSGLV